VSYFLQTHRYISTIAEACSVDSIHPATTALRLSSFHTYSSGKLQWSDTDLH